MVYVVLLFIVISYYLYAKYCKGKSFIVLNLLWATVIVILSAIFGKFGSISSIQIGIIAFVFAIDFIFVERFSKRLKLKVTKYLIFSAVILAPIVEEAFFRGWLLEGIRGSNLEKIVLCSILFGFYHFKNSPILDKRANLYQIAYAGLVIGPILAFAKLETGSIFLPIVIHSLNNTWSYTFNKLLFPNLNKYKDLEI